MAIDTCGRAGDPYLAYPGPGPTTCTACRTPDGEEAEEGEEEEGKKEDAPRRAQASHLSQISCEGTSH